MPRTISHDAMQAMLAEATSEVFIELLTIDHDDLAEPLRFCNNAETVTSNGNDYEPAPFFAHLPEDAEDREPRAKLTISNVDQSIVEAVRGLSGRPSFLLAVITESEPDTFQFDPHPFDVISVSGDAQTLVFDMVFSEYVQEVFPALTYSPVHFPALHKRTT